MKSLRQGAGWQAARQEFGSGPTATAMSRRFTQLRPVAEGLKISKSTEVPQIDRAVVAQLRFEHKNRAQQSPQFITPAQRAGLMALSC